MDYVIAIIALIALAALSAGLMTLLGVAFWPAFGAFIFCGALGLLVGSVIGSL